MLLRRSNHVWEKEQRKKGHREAVHLKTGVG
jgi:hypothetical protein